jgi:DNA-nicking Smr family endonuclease
MAALSEPRPGSHAADHRHELAAKPHPVPPSSHPKKVPPLADFNRKSARKLRSGQVEIEARIDLHGMRQSEAHTALRRFVLHCHSQDRRWVLVITGKGAPADRQRALHGFEGAWGEPERGVLRRNVPRWLAEPDLRAIVVSYTTAAIQHGGEGALYLQLRSRHR